MVYTVGSVAPPPAGGLYETWAACTGAKDVLLSGSCEMGEDLFSVGTPFMNDGNVAGNQAYRCQARIRANAFVTQGEVQSLGAVAHCLKVL